MAKVKDASSNKTQFIRCNRSVISGNPKEGTVRINNLTPLQNRLNHFLDYPYLNITGHQ